MVSVCEVEKFEQSLKKESVEAMKKILKTLVLFCVAVFSIQGANIVYGACPIDKMGNLTGAACSMRDVNSLESKRSNPGFFNLNSKKEKSERPERNLRPINFDYDAVEVQMYGNCPYGMCLQKSIFTLFRY